MATAMNRAEFRDAVRRDLQKAVPVDEGTGAVGDAPTDQTPNPNNATINQKLNEAIDYLNREAPFHANTDVEIVVGIQAGNGPAPVSLYTALGSQSSPGSLIDVRRASWDDGGGTITRLLPTTYDTLDRSRIAYEMGPADVPRTYWIEGYTLFLYPKPAAAGTLKMIAGTALLHFETDADTIDQLPITYHSIVQHLASWFTASTMPKDAEMTEAAARYQALALPGVEAVKKWVQRRNRQFQSGIPVASYGWSGLARRR